MIVAVDPHLHVTALERRAVEIVIDLIAHGLDPEQVVDHVTFPAWPGEDPS